LAQLRREPIVTFRAPGTRLRSRHDTLGGSVPRIGETVTRTSEVALIFSTGDAQPGDAVAAYEQAAKAGGWQLVSMNCERQTLIVSAVFARDTRSGPATTAAVRLLRVSEVVERHELNVTLRVDSVPNSAATPTSAGLPRRDSGCLRGFSPADPRRRPLPGTSGRTAEQLCDLLREPLQTVYRDDASRNRALDLRPWAQADSQFGSYWNPDTRASCSVSEGDLNIMIFDAATIPRAAYEDYQYSVASSAADLFFLTSNRYNQTDELYGAWIDTPRGPIELLATSFLPNGAPGTLPEKEFMRFAHLVRQAASAS